MRVRIGGSGRVTVYLYSYWRNNDCGSRRAVGSVRFFLDGFALTGYAWLRHRGELLDYARARWKPSLAGAILSTGAYAIAIWAMTKAPVAMVAALRETSVIIAAIIGATFLKEPLGAWRIAGAALVACGILALKL